MIVVRRLHFQGKNRQLAGFYFQEQAHCAITLCEFFSPERYRQTPLNARVFIVHCFLESLIAVPVSPPSVILVPNSRTTSAATTSSW